MAEIRTIASKKACGGSGVNAANTGKLGCLSLFGTPTNLLALEKGYEILGTDDFNSDYLKTLVKTGKAIPIIGAEQFEDVSSEDGYYSNQRGGKRLNLDGLPEYKLTFEEGHSFYKELSKMKSYKSYDYIIGDEGGNWMLATKSNGNYQGFTSGHTTPELTKRAVIAGDPEMKALVVQFLNRLQWDQNYDIIHAEDLDFTPDEISAINATEISFNTVPGDTDTTINLNVVLSADRHSSVEGLSVADFVITKGGVTQTATGIVETTGGNYVITISAAVNTSDVIIVSHWDGATNSFVADSNGVLYRNAGVTSSVVV